MPYGLRLQLGSPPHTRGKVGGVQHPLGRAGITPAHAGKRLVGNLCPSGGGDHPRTRGEKITFTLLSMFSPGSPPHTRGKGGYCVFFKDPVRITPAHAGKRKHDKHCYFHFEDHPRTRGEKSIVVVTASSLIGSPPHTRGKGPICPQCPVYPGITPAHAGKSLEVVQGVLGGQDHPRTRGEKTKRIPILSHCFQVKGLFSFSFS